MVLLADEAKTDDDGRISNRFYKMLKDIAVRVPGGHTTVQYFNAKITKSNLVECACLCQGEIFFGTKNVVTGKSKVYTISTFGNEAKRLCQIKDISYSCVVQLEHSKFLYVHKNTIYEFEAGDVSSFFLGSEFAVIVSRCYLGQSLHFVIPEDLSLDRRSVNREGHLLAFERIISVTKTAKESFELEGVRFVVPYIEARTSKGLFKISICGDTETSETLDDPSACTTHFVRCVLSGEGTHFSAKIEDIKKCPSCYGP